MVLIVLGIAYLGINWLTNGATHAWFEKQIQNKYFAMHQAVPEPASLPPIIVNSDTTRVPDDWPYPYPRPGTPPPIF